MNNIGSLLTSALEAYLIGLIYRNTRTSCRSLARLCARMSHDTLRRVLSSRLGFVANFLLRSVALLSCLRVMGRGGAVECKGSHFEKEIILWGICRKVSESYCMLKRLGKNNTTNCG